MRMAKKWAYSFVQQADEGIVNIGVDLACLSFRL